jgi:hypothetical protein
MTTWLSVLGLLFSIGGLTRLATAGNTGDIIAGYCLLGIGIVCICYNRYGGDDGDGW